MEEQSNQTFDQILNETLEPSVVKEERKETGVNESPAEKSVDDKKEQNKPEENYRLNLEKIETVTIQTCEEATVLIQKRSGIALRTILSVEKKCEEEYYYDEQVISSLITGLSLESLTQNDCETIQQRMRSLIEKNNEEVDDKKSDERDHEQRIEQLTAEEKFDQAEKQRDDLEEIREEQEELQQKAERLIILERMIRKSCTLLSS